jgi:asparagine synthase (glutamine-hydrolysing)
MDYNVNIFVGNRFYANKKNNVIYCSGHIFINDEVYTNQQLSDYFSEKFTPNNIEEVINSIDGHFAIIIQFGNEIFLIVDRSRSIPLFYSKVNRDIFISDKADLIDDKIFGTNDNLAISEFKLIGSCIGDKTIIKEIKQVKTANYAQISLDDKEAYFVQKEYFNYRKKKSIYSKTLTTDLLNELDNVFLKIFEQLIRFADGKTIVVPLSGGLDSRLIVYFLNRLNYKNVLCFTYGKPDNWEAKISKNIAKRAGFEWKMIPYTRQMWNEYIHATEAKSLFSFASNLSSLPLFQDCLAIKELVGVIPENSIFVPGISGDFLAGSHISNDLLEVNTFSRENVINKYLLKNNLFNINSPNSGAYKNLVVNSFVNTEETNTLFDFINEYENLDYNERQSKYIVNSCRVYEYFGYNWSLPFFFKDSLYFWRNLELDQKIGKKLFLKYLEGRFLFEEINFKEKSKLIKVKKKDSKIVSFLKKTYRELKNWKKIFLDYYTHEMQWYGVFNNYLEYLFFSIKNYKRDTNLSLRYVSFIVKRFTKY